MLIPIGFFGGAVDTGAFDHLASSILTSTATSVSFDTSTYVGKYKHLQIRGIVSGTDTVDDAVWIRFNSDSGTNYITHMVLGNGSGIVSAATSGKTGLLTIPSTSSGTSGIYSPMVTDVRDAFSSTKNKTIRTLSGTLDSGASYNRIWLASGAWLNTAAITSIYIAPGGSNPGTGVFKANTRFSLYGIKG